MNFIVSHDAFRLLISRHLLEDSSRLGEHFVIFYRYFGFPIVDEDVFQLSAPVPRDVGL